MELLNHVAVLKYQRTGSSYTCDPPVLNTDEDWVVLVKDEHRNDFGNLMFANGFDYQNYDDYKNLKGANEFTSWRRQMDYVPTEEQRNDNRNFIVTYNPEWYQLFVEATEIAKEENLLTKEERVACFEMIMRKYRKADERSEAAEYRKDTPSEKTKDWTLVEEFNQRLQTQQANYNQAVLATQRTSTLWSRILSPF